MVEEKDSRIIGLFNLKQLCFEVWKTKGDLDTLLLEEAENVEYLAPVPKNLLS